MNFFCIVQETGELYVSTTGTYCPDGEDVTTEAECRQAAIDLSIQFASAWNGSGSHKYCIYADDGRNKIFFNSSPTPANTPSPKYGSICFGSKNNLFTFQFIIMNIN